MITHSTGQKPVIHSMDHWFLASRCYPSWSRILNPTKSGAILCRSSRSYRIGGVNYRLRHDSAPFFRAKHTHCGTIHHSSIFYPPRMWSLNKYLDLLIRGPQKIKTIHYRFPKMVDFLLGKFKITD